MHAMTEGLACPACGGALTAETPELKCGGCGRSFATVAGIPDLRVAYTDPYVSRDEDLERARELAERFGELDLAGMLRLHWKMSGKPVELAERFLTRDLGTVQTSAAYLARVERFRGSPLGRADSFLEVGCGTAGLAAVASARAGDVVATDVSMRWLVLAKKRLESAGIEAVRLVCAGAERPPFEAGRFDVIGASDVIEHVDDPDRFVAGCSGVLRRGGVLFLATPNRYSLGLEPHVRLWGVGFLPRSLAKKYVGRARRTSYDHVRLMSSRALRRAISAQGLSAMVEAPPIPDSAQSVYSGVEAALIRVYNLVRELPGVRTALLAFGPFFHVYGIKGES